MNEYEFQLSFHELILELHHGIRRRFYEKIPLIGDRIFARRVLKALRKLSDGGAR